MNLKKIFYLTSDLLSYKEKRKGIIVITVLIITAFLDMIGVASIFPFLSVVSNPELISSNIYLRYSFDKLNVLGIATQKDFTIFLGIFSTLIIISSSIFKSFAFYYSTRYVELTRYALGLKLLKSYLHQPYNFYMSRHSGDISKNILSEVDLFTGNILQPALNLIAQSCLLITVISLLILIDPFIAFLTSFVFLFIYLIFIILFKKQLQSLGNKIKQTNKERYISVKETFSSIKDIKLLQKENFFIENFKFPTKEYALIQSKFRVLSQLPNYIIEAIIFGSLILLTINLILIYGSLDSSLILETIPLIGLYGLAAIKLKPASNIIYVSLQSLRFGQQILENLHKEVSLNTAKSLLKDKQKQEDYLNLNKNIKIENLCFKYQNSNKFDLYNVNLTIKSGSLTGIIGKSGSGKTTLVDSILLLLTPNSGTIKVDNIEINSNNQNVWQKKIGYVPQDIVLSDASIAENIAFGIKKDFIDYNQIINCLKLTQLLEYVDNPNYNVGENGILLSGGQRQRIGIARALYNNPKILILDEATSALDVVTERDLMKDIQSLAGKLTIILVAHRLSTVKKCDTIYYLDNGQIRAEGDYDYLFKSDKEFHSMINLS